MRTLVLVAALAVALSGCGGGEDAAAPPPTATVEAPPPPRTAPATEQAETTPPPAPETGTEQTTTPRPDPIRGESVAGGEIGLDDFRGRYLFVNVWSSW